MIKKLGILDDYVEGGRVGDFEDFAQLETGEGKAFEGGERLGGGVSDFENTTVVVEEKKAAGHMLNVGGKTSLGDVDVQATGQDTLEGDVGNVQVLCKACACCACVKEK